MTHNGYWGMTFEGLSLNGHVSMESEALEKRVLLSGSRQGPGTREVYL